MLENKKTAQIPQLPQPSARARRLHLTGLIAVVALGGFLRFGGITDVGIRFDDESWYTSDARMWHRCAALAVDTQAIHAALTGDKEAFNERRTAIGTNFIGRYDKPSVGYTFLSAGMMFIVGDRPAAMFVTNAVCGTLTIIVLYAFSSLFFGRAIALTAAALLAVSPYHLVYCRSALSETSATLFVLLGVLFWSLGQLGRWRWKQAYWLAGVALGWACLCHFRSAVFVVLLVVFDAIVARQSLRRSARSDTPWPGLLRRYAWLCVGIIAPMLVIELILQGAHLAAWLTDSYFPLPTLFEAFWAYAKILLRFVGSPVRPVWSISIPLAYWPYWIHWHGLIAGILTIVGAVTLIRHRNAARWPLFCLFGVGVFACSQQFTIGRAISPTIPFAVLCMAMGIHALVTTCVRGNKLVTPAVLLATVLVALPAAGNSWQLFHTRSHIADARTFIVSRGGGSVAVPCDKRKYQVEFDRTGVKIVGENWRWATADPAQLLRQWREQGIRWVVTDAQHWHYVDPQHRWDDMFTMWQDMDALLRQEARLAIEFTHVADYRWAFLVEGSGLSVLPQMIAKNGGLLRVYELEPYIPRNASACEQADSSRVVRGGQ